MIHPTPAKVLLATTLQPLVVQLSGSLAHGARLIDQFLHDEPRPQKIALQEHSAVNVRLAPSEAFSKG
jgi:hypothetical protein